MKISAIYIIQSKIKPKRIYIGSAVNYHKRKQLHLCELRKNKHHSNILQNHYNKYGESDLQFSVLLGCEKEDLIKTEQYFIDSYNPYFNVCKIAGNCLGIKYKRSDANKLKQSLLRKGNKNLLGFKFSDESKKKMRQSHLGIKFSQERKDKMSKSMKGIKKPPFSDQHKINIGIASKNRLHKKGRHWKLSEETKQKLSKIAKGKSKSIEHAQHIKESWVIRKLNKNKIA